MPKLLGGRGVNGKIIMLTPYDTEGDDDLLYLTMRQRQLMLTLTEYMDWKSRWATLPDGLDNDDTRDAYIADLKDRLMIVVNFCEKMIECFTGDTDVQDAIKALMQNLIENDVDIQFAIQQVNQQGINHENPLNQSSQNGNLLSGIGDCAFNNLWSASFFLVDWLHRNNEDFLDRIATAATPAERGAALSKGIKGFNGAALGEALSVAMTFLSSQMVNNYDAFYDISYQNDLACEIFCISQGTCEISIRQLYLIFAARVGYTPTADLFYQGFLFAVTGSWTGVNFVDVMMFVQLGAFIFMGGFAGWDGINPLANAASQGWDDPNDDWMTLCACPELWTHTLHSDDLATLLAFPGTPSFGTITGELISQTTDVLFSQDTTGIYLEITFPSIQTMAGFSIHATNVANVEGATVVNHFFVYQDASLVNIGGTAVTLPDTNGEWNASFSEAIPGVKKIIVQYLYIGDNQTMDFEIVLSGFGTNPF